MNSIQPCPECGKPLPAGSDHCPACLMAQAMASHTLDAGPRRAVPPPEPEEIADKFPQFAILECLGRGGMGVVYKARQKSLNRLVAIKILAPERERDARFAERFAREAELLAKLSHPHIVTIHDFGETGGLYYLVMEFINGVNVRDLLRDGKMPPEQALAIVPPICDALQFAHDHGIVHRDIKPENILLDREGRVKIADFGIATLAGDATDHSGTPAYMAPEQAGQAGKIDHRADIYALGVVLYEMLTGERPTAFPVAPSRRVQIDVRLDEVVLRALAHQPERRFQSAGEFNTVLEQATHAVVRPGTGRNAETLHHTTHEPSWMPATAELPWTGSRVLMLVIMPMVALLVVRASGLFKPYSPLASGNEFTVFINLTWTTSIVVFAMMVVIAFFRSIRRMSLGSSAPATPTGNAPVPLGEWQLRCTSCGNTRSLADAGGIRIGAASVGKRTLAWCRACGGLRFAAIERAGELLRRNAVARGPAYGGREGMDYRSKRTFLGLPLVHVASGTDPLTGNRRIALGWLAVGDTALGFFSFGGVAMGVFSFGGVSIGLVGYGGVALGLIAIGGLGVGLLGAFAGLAVGAVAVGGMAVGYYAHGGSAFGEHLLSPSIQDPEAIRFFKPWAATALSSFMLWNSVILVLVFVINVGMMRWAMLKSAAAPMPPSPARNSGTDGSSLGKVLLHFSPALLLVVAWFSSGLERGAVLILSVVLVATLVVRALASRGSPRL